MKRLWDAHVVFVCSRPKESRNNAPGAAPTLFSNDWKIRRRDFQSLENVCSRFLSDTP